MASSAEKDTAFAPAYKLKKIPLLRLHIISGVRPGGDVILIRKQD
jgi:hypothetical protein